MNFNQFQTVVMDEIGNYLPENFSNAKIAIHKVTKNNDQQMVGLVIKDNAEKDKKNCMVPTIYLEEYYEDYENGKPMYTILQDIANVRVANGGFTCDLDLKDFALCKSKIFPALIGKKWNGEYLHSNPHTDIGDLAVVYRILVGQDGNSTSAGNITYHLMNTWGIDEKTLHENAIQNMTRQYASHFCNMASMLGVTQENLGEAAEMYVLFNDSTYGATAVLDDAIMKSAVRQLGDGFILLPSSIHEFIVIPNHGLDIGQLTSMVQEVNGTEVAPVERLSDHPYKYTLKKGLMPMV